VLAELQHQIPVLWGCRLLAGAPVMPLPQFGSGLEVIAHHLVRTEASSADVRLMCCDEITGVGVF